MYSTTRTLNSTINRPTTRIITTKQRTLLRLRKVTSQLPLRTLHRFTRTTRNNPNPTRQSRPPRITLQSTTDNSRIRRTHHKQMSTSIMNQHTSSRHIMTRRITRRSQFINRQGIMRSSQTSTPTHGLTNSTFNRLLHITMRQAMNRRCTKFSLMTTRAIMGVRCLQGLPLPCKAINQASNHKIRSTSLYRHFLRKTTMFTRSTNMMTTRLIPMTQQIRLQVNSTTISDPRHTRDITERRHPNFNTPHSRHFKPICRQHRMRQRHLHTRQGHITLLSFRHPNISTMRTLSRLRHLNVTSSPSIKMRRTRNTSKQQIIQLRIVSRRMISQTITSHLTSVFRRATSRDLFSNISRNSLLIYSRVYIM